MQCDAGSGRPRRCAVSRLSRDRTTQDRHFPLDPASVGWCEGRNGRRSALGALRTRQKQRAMLQMLRSAKRRPLGRTPPGLRLPSRQPGRGLRPSKRRSLPPGRRRRRPRCAARLHSARGRVPSKRCRRSATRTLRMRRARDFVLLRRQRYVRVFSAFLPHRVALSRRSLPLT